MNKIKGDLVNLEDLMLDYKELSVKIIDDLGQSKFDDLNNLFMERQKIIDEINLKNCTKEQLKQLYVEYELLKLDERMKREFEEKKEDLKKKIANLKKRKVASESYNKLNGKAVFLSREI